MKNIKTCLVTLGLLAVICTTASSQGLEFGLGPGPENPFDFAFSVRYHMSGIGDNTETFGQLSIHAFNLKPWVEKSIGSALGQPRFAFGRETGWSKDWHVAVGGGLRKYLQHRQKKLNFFVELTGLLTYERYKVKDSWVQHHDSFVAYSEAAYAVYHSSVTGALGYKFRLRRGIDLLLTPLSLRADLALVTVPAVASPKRLEERPSAGIKLIRDLSSVDRKTGLNSELNLFDGPILTIRLTL